MLPDAIGVNVFAVIALLPTSQKCALHSGIVDTYGEWRKVGNEEAGREQRDTAAGNGASVRCGESKRGSDRRLARSGFPHQGPKTACTMQLIAGLPALVSMPRQLCQFCETGI